MKKMNWCAILLMFVLLLAMGTASATPCLPGSYEIPVMNGYVEQTFSMDDCQGKLVFSRLKLDPAYEGFLTLWTRGEARRIIVHMNKSSISVQVDKGEVKTVLQESTGLLYGKTLEVQIDGDKAVLTLGGRSYTVEGVTAFTGKLESIGISGKYDVCGIAEDNQCTGATGSASATPRFGPQGSHEIPVMNGYVEQTFSMDDYQGKLVFSGLKLDPAYEGFLTLWTRGEARRIIVHMNKSSISVQVDKGDVHTVLQERTGLLYGKTLSVQIIDDKAVLTLGGQSYTVEGVTAFTGKLESIGISGKYDVYRKNNIHIPLYD